VELVIISGRSGSGKSTALHQLEDLGFYCVDNLPAALLPTLTLQLEREQYQSFRGIAVCIDVRNSIDDLRQITAVIETLPETVNSQILFLDAKPAVLTKRFSETRRRHPLSSDKYSLPEAIAHENDLLISLSQDADLVIDTSDLTLYDLRAMISARLGSPNVEGLSLLVESFGFKRGVPSDADLVFDARLLPNPHWESHLRPLTGQDSAVAQFLENHPQTQEFVDDITKLLVRWLPAYSESQRTYMTIAIGCTGGQHRSVYVAEAVFRFLQSEHRRTQIRHRELSTMVTA
jgi:UPF0042 nucleotide-binding protein